MEVERKYWSFLDGEWKLGSWPHYYMMTIAYKTPEATLLATLIGCFYLLVCWVRGLLTKEITVFLILWCVPALLFFLLISLQGGFNHHHRYVLNVYPPMFILASVLASPMSHAFLGSQRVSWRRWLIYSLALLSALSIVKVHPFYTSYFNSLSGGPENGWKRLGFSNVDWGQDLKEVERWLIEHPRERPVCFELDYFGFNGELFGLPARQPVRLPTGASIDDARRNSQVTQWCIVSVKTLYDLPGHDGLEYLQQIDPVDRIAFSYHVYRIDPFSPEGLPIEGDSNKKP
jgi:hypothetical protein